MNPLIKEQKNEQKVSSLCHFHFVDGPHFDKKFFNQSINFSTIIKWFFLMRVAVFDYRRIFMGFFLGFLWSFSTIDSPSSNKKPEEKTRVLAAFICQPWYVQLLADYCRDFTYFFNSLHAIRSFIIVDENRVCRWINDLPCFFSSSIVNE